MAEKAATMRMVLCWALTCVLVGCSGSDDAEMDLAADDGETIDVYAIEPSSIETFRSISGEICRQDGKPIVRLFSTTWCSHCQWIARTYDDVVTMYLDGDEIVAYHWEVDTGDDTLTSHVEGSVPESEEAVFTRFNPDESIPTFVFGCKYYRIGNGHEGGGGLEAEAAEFMAVIEALLSE